MREVLAHLSSQAWTWEQKKSREAARMSAWVQWVLPSLQSLCFLGDQAWYSLKGSLPENQPMSHV